MPGIDASLEILPDGFIAGTPFVCIRRRSWTDTNGMEQHSHSNINAFGSIDPTGDQSLLRLPDEQAQNKQITVVTNLLLRGASSVSGSQWQPDLVFWQGEHFLVHDIEDFSQYGAGMVAARCVAFDYTNRAEPEGNAPVFGICQFNDRRNSAMIKVVSP